MIGLFDKVAHMLGYAMMSTSQYSHVAVMHVSYIEPEARGEHLSYMLYQSRILMAVQQPQLKIMQCMISGDNEPSLAVARRFGFKPQNPLSTGFTQYYEHDLDDLRKGILRPDIAYDFGGQDLG